MRNSRKKIGSLILPLYMAVSAVSVPLAHAEEPETAETENSQTVKITAGGQAEIKLPLSEREYTAEESEYVRIVSGQKTDAEVILTAEALKETAEPVTLKITGDEEYIIVFEITGGMKEEEPAEAEASEIPAKTAETETEAVEIADELYEISVTDGKITGDYVTEDGLTKAKPGTELTVKASGKTGYLFTGWSVSGLDNIDKKSSRIIFSMPEASVSLKANYLYRWKENDNGKRYIVSLNEKGSPIYAKNEWIPEAGSWYYFDSDGYALRSTLKSITNKQGTAHTFGFKDDSTMAVGWFKAPDGYYYHFNSDGYMETGWYRNGSVWYYLLPDSGRMAAGWQTIKSKKYYFRSDGQMVTGQHTVDGVLYSFESSGALKTNCWLKISDIWYYLNSDGQYAVGWKEIKGKKYYFKNNGQMQTGWLTTGSDRYYFAQDGSLQKTGWTKIDNVWYFLDLQNGKAKTGWHKEGDIWYYLKSDGAMAVGWAKDSGSWYYFNGSGVMQKGWKQISGKWYYLTASGAMKTGWLKDGGVWYFLKSDGAMAVGWAKDGSTWYYFSNSGVMQKGWKQISGKWYYFASSGAMKTGWLKEGNHWYYLKADGDMAVGWVKAGADYYYMNKSGVMQTGWLTIGRNKYYLKNSGAMTTGIAKVDGIVRYFDSISGVLKNIEVPLSASDVVMTASSADGKSNAAAAALFTALKAKGYDFETYDAFLAEMPTDEVNPMKGYYAGDIRSIYPAAACDWVSQYGKSENISGITAEALLDQVNSGRLVVVWIPADFSATAQVKKASFGNYITSTQAAVVYGYDSLTGEVKVAVPSGKGLTSVSFSIFKAAYEKLKYAITIY